jgi:hypothetical protein
MNRKYLIRQRRLAALRIRAEVEHRKAQRGATPAKIPAQKSAAADAASAPTR